MLWLKVSSISGASAIAIAAMFAHKLKGGALEFEAIFKTASTYHLLHSGVMMASALNFTGRKRNIVCSLLACGIVFFSLPLYIVSLRQDRSVFGKFTPVGGMSLIFAWLAIGFL